MLIIENVPYNSYNLNLTKRPLACIIILEKRKGLITMKSDYRIRAKKFLKSIFPYIDGYMWDLDDIFYQVEKYNDDKKRNVLVSHGSARVALITSDYVIKWDYDNGSAKEIGGCDDEYRAYQEAKQAGYEYLLAEVTPVEYQGLSFIIMPRIDKVGKCYNGGDIQLFLTREEYKWIFKFNKDIHSYNWGIRNGKACLIDYAFSQNVYDRNGY